MLAFTITNRDLLLVRLLAHVLLLYWWMPAPVLCAIRERVANLNMVFPDLFLELQVFVRCAIITVNHMVADVCSEETTSQWMQQLIVAPTCTYTVWLAFIGGPW